jgi:cellulose synthase/poly-beta-1,6-N-acetylglucosamine synthase-like glycosyltransferase
MNNLLLIPVAVIYFLVTGTLFLYGVNFLYMTYLALRAQAASQPPALPANWPRVTVQLPIFNEKYVAARLVDAAANLDYPLELLEIQVLDDSTDETVRIVAASVQAARQRGVNVVHLHRRDRDGYKAGALRDGYAQASGEFFAIFDADFLPPSDFLRRTIPQFADPKVAFVQARWGHVNRDFSFLTLLQSLSIDAHFMVEQLARSTAGYWFNFNGTAGVWRGQAIANAGGWKADTLTEDLDLSYRAFLKGWKAAYISDLQTPAELPVSFTAFRRQQHRWARGSLECAVRLLPEVWASDFPLRFKLEASFHLTGYGVHLLLFAYALLYPLVIWLSRDFPGLVTLFGIAYIFILTSLAPTFLFIAAQHKLKRKWGQWFPFMLLISAFGSGMMLNTVRAAWQAANRTPNEFKRTPKFGVTERSTDWVRRAYQLNLDPIVWWELLFAAFNIGTIILGLRYGHWLIAIYAGLFAFGLLFTSLYTILQTLYIRRSQMQAAPTNA